MSFSYTNSNSNTFTITHAKRIGSKVAADLKRLQRFYQSPSDEMIVKYEDEIALFLKNGYLKQVSYGFQRDGNWIEPSLHYSAKDLNGWSEEDDDPGKIKPGADISGAQFYSFLVYSDKWWELSQAERDSFKDEVPINRSSANQPGVDGYLVNDRTYSAGGKSLIRSVVKKY